MLRSHLFALVVSLGMGAAVARASVPDTGAPHVRIASSGSVVVSWKVQGKTRARTELRIFKQDTSEHFSLFDKKMLPAGIRKASLPLILGTYQFRWRMPSDKRYAKLSKPSAPIEVSDYTPASPVPPETFSPAATLTPIPTTSAMPTVTITPTATFSPTPTESSGTLLPGNGFAGPSTDPFNIGSPTDVGYNAEVIARWDAVPFQVVKSALRIGVVAYHRNGIAKVSFSANGGAWVDINERSINPDTGISEYWAALQASNFPDGKVEVRAIAYPKGAGKPRLLAGTYQASAGASPALDGVYSLILWTNAYGSFDRPEMFVSSAGSDITGDGSAATPYQTLARAAQSLQETFGSVDGATIFCYPGEYSFSMKWGYTFASASERMLTIMPAAGVTREQVVISAGRPKVGKVHLLDVTLKTDETGNFYLGYTDLIPDLWLEGVKVSALNGRYTPNSSSVLIKANTYVTESEWSDTPDGPVGSILVRNSLISKIKSDLVSGSQIILSVTGSDINPADTGAHPDVWQIYRPDGTLNNHVIDGLKAQDGILAQGIFIAALPANEKIRNVALVNIVIKKAPSFFTSQINKDCEHLIIANVTLDQTFFIRAKNFSDTSFQGNLFSSVTLDLNKTTPQDVATIDWQHNHFVDVTSYGTYSFGGDLSTGVAPVIDWEAGDFRPLSNSFLSKRAPSLFSNYDVNMQPRHQPLTAIGALEELP